MATRLALPRNQVFDANGAPLPGAKLYTFATGTSTPKATYSDAGLTVPNANPLIADSAGRFGDIFAAADPYKVDLRTAADVSVWVGDAVDGNLTTTYTEAEAAALRTAISVPSIAELQAGQYLWAGTTGGTSTAITASLTPVLTVYTTGMRVAAIVGTTCGDQPTLNLNTIGARALYVRRDAGPVRATNSDLSAGNQAVFCYSAALNSGAGGFFIEQESGAEMRLRKRNVLSGAVAQVDFVVPAGALSARVDFSNVVPATNDVSLSLRVSTDNGATYLTTNIYFALGGQFLLAGYATAFGTLTGSFPLTAVIANTRQATGWVQFDPASPYLVNFQSYCISSAVVRQPIVGSGDIAPGARITNVRLLMSSGNIASGSFFFSTLE